MWVALIEGFADLYHNKSDNWKADWITKIHIGWIWGLEAHMMYCRILICGFVKSLCTYNSRINGHTWLCFPCGCLITNWPHRTMSDLIWMAVQHRRRHMLCDITHHHNLLKPMLLWCRPDSQFRPTNTMHFSNSSDGHSVLDTLTRRWAGGRHCRSITDHFTTDISVTTDGDLAVSTKLDAGKKLNQRKRMRAECTTPAKWQRAYANMNVLYV